jgi:peptidoglycan hydrolase-like protein with peptidoglycan-binding domain
MPNTGLRLISRSWRWPPIAASLTTVVAIAVAVAAGAFLFTNRNGSAQAAASHKGDPAGAATVQRRDLVETDTESGTLSYANPQTVYDGLSGTITWLPSVGQVIKPGHLLFKVDEQPVILMNGMTPAYRDLGPSDSAGPDIKQLNRDLVKLGFNPDGIVVDSQWQAATTAGVEEFQAAHHMTATGTLTLGQIVFLPGPQLVGTLDATVGSSGSGGGSSSNSSSSSSSSSSNAGNPSGGGNAQAIMQTSSTELVATVDLDASKQSEAKVGEKVTVELPNGNAVDGVISAVSPVAQSSSNSGSSSGSSDSSGNSDNSNSGTGGSSSGSTIPVTVRLKGRRTGAGLDQAAVSVNFAQARAKNVLSVPLTALVATSGNSYAVQEARAPHKLIAVTVGLFSAGYVQISGAGVYPGLEVTDSQG